MPITWRNIDAPDFSSAAGIMQQGSQNIQGALNNLAGMAQQKVADDTAANTAALMEGIRQNVTDTASYDAFDLNQAAQQYGGYADKNAALQMLLGLGNQLNQEDQALAANAARIQAANITAKGQNDRWVQNNALELERQKFNQLTSNIETDYQKILSANPVPPEFEPDEDPQARTNFLRSVESTYRGGDGEWLTFGEESGQALMKKLQTKIADFDKEFKEKYGTVAPSGALQLILASLPKTEDLKSVVIDDFDKVKNDIMKTYAPSPQNYKERKRAKEAKYNTQRKAQEEFNRNMSNIIYGRK